MNMLSRWFSSNGLMPHGFCYQWKPALIWLHVGSDTLIALAYFSIPIVLVYFVRKRRDLPFGWMFLCFGVFITACGATHLMEVWTLWVPSYWFSGGVKVITALASVPTAIFLVRLMPAALSLPSPEKMRTTIDQLRQREAVLKESQERFRRMADNIQEIFWTMDPETKQATYASPAFEQICELPLASLYSNPTSYLELIHPEDRQRIMAGLEKLKDTNHFDEEFRIICPSGNLKWLRGIGFVAKDSEGNVLTLLGTAQEITARKEMELRLRESEDRYRDLVENSTDLICTYDLQGRLLSLNELPAKLLGYSREELLNMPLRNIVVPEGRTQFDDSLLAIQRDGFVKGSMSVITKTGERRIWEYHNTLRTEGVAAPVVRGMAHDVTDRKLLEKALRLSEEKFAKAFHSSPVEIAITTLEGGRFLDVNAAFERNSGFTRDEVLGHTSIELGIWKNPKDREFLVEEVAKHGCLQDWEMSFRTKSGKTRVTRYSAEEIKIDRKQCLLAVCEDITERKKIEEALRISEEKFSKAFRSSPSLISICTLREGIFLEVNDSFERHTGYERHELLGRTALDVGLWVDPIEMERLATEIGKQGYARDQEVHIRGRSGQTAVIQLSVESLDLSGERCLLTVGQDITERKKAEEDLRRMSGLILRLQDEERRRIAQDLHDSTAQNLVALATMIGQLNRSSQLNGRKSGKLLAECKALADRCIREVRTLSYTLYPVVLDGVGLVGSIRDYVKGFAKRSGIHVDLQLSTDLGRMARNIELTLFRIVQEGLTNIQRHSGSHRAKLRIDGGSILKMEISDSGRGVIASRTETADPHFEFGVGISSMQERLRLIGGRLEIDSDSKGTRLIVTIPLEGARA
jgi:PAS domain S-box-containing protein